jgi:hypothetical protein
LLPVTKPEDAIFGPSFCYLNMRSLQNISSFSQFSVE